MLLWSILPSITLSIIASAVGWFLIRHRRTTFGLLSGLAIIALATILFILWERLTIASEYGSFTVFYVLAGVLSSTVIFLLVSAAASAYYERFFEWLQTFLYTLGAVAIAISLMNFGILQFSSDAYSPGGNSLRIYGCLAGVVLGLGMIILAATRGKRRRDSITDGR